MKMMSGIFYAIYHWRALPKKKNTVATVLLNEFDKVNNTTIKYKLDLIRICRHTLQLRSCDKTNMAVSKTCASS